MGSDWVHGRGWEGASVKEQGSHCMLWAAGARGLLTDMLGRQPHSLDHQRLLPPLRDAVQDPALDREYGWSSLPTFYMYYY